MTLVSVANEAEAESSRDGSMDSTTARDIARLRVVRSAQEALVDDIRQGRESGLTLEQIASELITGVLDRSVVGDVARFALDQALRSATHARDRDTRK